ncbi:hypothetical protein Mgra_00003119 [Meloidogyne graminicola]|uniref:tRNA pseudouridine(55) synthase n=1 Tax=Meloidogyne graminicola TaxID=189291 RepID=A0A8S9ZWD3_9BILA|nr:hypothetical protein Mgra_00003119 [Meloidogyne graminicola]
MTSPSTCCKFNISLERDTIFIAGRYCKYSRNLPQSAWGSSDGENEQNGESVGERISDVFVKHFGATSSRFTPSGREDVDVRMLGKGRPFVVQLLNARKNLNDNPNILNELANQINSDLRKEVFVNSLAQKKEKSIRLFYLKDVHCLTAKEQFFWMKAQQLDSFHFILRLQTQAGTYVKEFVHSDFGRTCPSLAELMNLKLGILDILKLDVLSVELEWPPT